MTGNVFNIQRFSVHDGPGIRTTVFLKGCNLRCRWCHNPESYIAKPQLQYFPDKCVECGMCRTVCPKDIYVKDKKRIGDENCLVCGKCAEVCMTDALKCTGKAMTVDEVLKVVLRDRKYYENSGGGLTVSGGEPLMQPEFTRELLKAAKENGISTALDTAGCVPWERFETALPYADLVLLDIKIMDPDLHLKYTGQDNRLILENAKKLQMAGQKLHIRVPVMKGINDTMENAEKLHSLLDGYDNVEEIKLLPYHDMGLLKAESIGLNMERFEPPVPEVLKELEHIFGDRIHS